MPWMYIARRKASAPISFTVSRRYVKRRHIRRLLIPRRFSRQYVDRSRLRIFLRRGISLASRWRKDHNFRERSPEVGDRSATPRRIAIGDKGERTDQRALPFPSRGLWFVPCWARFPKFRRFEPRDRRECSSTACVTKWVSVEEKHPDWTRADHVENLTEYSQGKCFSRLIRLIRPIWFAP